MNINIGENIKKLRYKKQVTQEQLADFLNISNVAVSKWERGETYPDISFLPILAKYFDVTIDTLIGYNSAKNKEFIEKIKKEYWQLRINGLFKKATEYINKAYIEYYDDYTIMYLYMIDLIGGKIASEKILLENKEKILHISDKILSGCNDEKIRLEAINMKAKLLFAEGDKKKALEMLQRLPDFGGTVGIKSEELFCGYETADSQYWIRKNLYSLSQGFAIRLIKKILFNNDYSIETKKVNCENICNYFYDIYSKTNETAILFLSHKLYENLALWTISYFGSEDDIIRIKNRELECAKELDKICINDIVLKEIINEMCNGKSLVERTLEFLDTAPQKTYQRMRRSEKFNKLLDMYR